MSVNIQDLDAILKEFYLGPIIESLNNQLEMVQLFEKSTLDWQGRQVVIPVHVSRNNGTGYRPEQGTLPTAGKQGHVNLNVKAKYLYGRFSLTGPAIATARTTANSFATYVQTEMDGLVTDTKIKANQAMYTGAGCIGFLHETNVQAQNTAAVAYAFTGNKDVALELQLLDTNRGGAPAPATARLQVDLIKLDDYTSAVAGNQVLMDAAAGTSSQCLLDTTAGTTVTLDQTGNFGVMVQVIRSGQVTIAAGPVITFAEDQTGGIAANAPCELRVNAEQMGIYGNLGTIEHFTVNRSTAVNAPLRSVVQSISNGARGHGNQALDFGRMQGILDELTVLGGDDPDCIYIHPVMRQKYADKLVFTNPGSIKKSATGDVGTGDPGFSGYAFNGIPVKMSRHCGKGLMVFLKTKTWSIAELQSFGMADLDGNVLSRLSNLDEFEGFVRWYYNLVCKEPNRNAILCGIDFPA